MVSLTGQDISGVEIIDLSGNKLLFSSLRLSSFGFAGLSLTFSAKLISISETATFIDTQTINFAPFYHSAVGS